MTDVALALGSNLGNCQQNIEDALVLLENSGFELLIVSRMMSSEPVDCPDGSGVFLNGALIGRWAGECRELMELCQKIEKQLGRPENRVVNAPLPVDIDILLFGDKQICESDLLVPHIRMFERDFVMLPLNEIASEWVVPGKEKTVGEC
ncbi:MAG: 2-amino-4-hydroxy-6-hydroxymethyldihydropteridine diphosphokinase, partial [Lentisphaeraceae bacterium]|nr:2-amino-4-hydroxy-6-hydroxymethyldihydropteridine diphosphokinase [Lentisphaeraceae bacterium]